MASLENIQRSIWDLNSAVSKAKQAGDRDPVIETLVGKMMMGADAKTVRQLADQLIAHINGAEVNPYNYQLNDAVKGGAQRIADAAMMSELEQGGTRNRYVARQPAWTDSGGVARRQAPETGEEDYLFEEKSQMSEPERPYSGASSEAKFPKWASVSEKEKKTNQYKDITFRDSKQDFNHEGFMDVKKAHKIALAEANRTYNATIKKLAQMAPGLLPGGEISMGEGANVPAVGKDYGSYSTPAQNLGPNRAVGTLRDKLREAGAETLVNFDYHYDVAESTGKWGSVLRYYQTNYQPMQVELNALKSGNAFLQADDLAALNNKINDTRARYNRAVQQAQASKSSSELLKTANNLYRKYLQKK